ncbi:splicing factor 3b subunit 2 [Anaeramoeba flamelloides]|uniref:Splicing factor 3b subunit 2 n=1 Tax=Anaeramoeba flamelloides TaxID=1746091 RepID=A0ABQ8XHW1_9EUKA|nr:splicing factor 3b subunit 2 [Anaeramoeba flamelloides]
MSTVQLTSQQKKILKKKIRAKLKRLKRRERKKQRRKKATFTAQTKEEIKKEITKVSDEYEISPLQNSLVNNPEFSNLVQKFDPNLQEETSNEIESEKMKNGDGGYNNGENGSGSEYSDEEDIRLSRKKLKKLNRLTVSQLKQLVRKPEVVELHDPNSSDPRLLIYLKSYRNTVPVPRHWSSKSRYLHGKRGFLKDVYKLPHFVEKTGISKIRTALIEQDEEKSSKRKQREQVMPKMKRMEIDYKILYDAFFKYQTKPSMTEFGNLYYEKKELEMKFKGKQPGLIGERLKEALGIPEGAPPPWLIAQQKYGPPPSYQNLRIPGLNAPIPPNAKYGYQRGGWGMLPVDEFGKPIYGKAFQQIDLAKIRMYDHEIERNNWGELEEEVYESEDESEEEEESEEEKSDLEEEGEFDEDQLDHELESRIQIENENINNLLQPGQMMSGISSTIPSGFQTPMMMQLRKDQDKSSQVSASNAQDNMKLFTVIDKVDTSQKGNIMGTEFLYDLSNITNSNVNNSNVLNLQNSNQLPNSVNKQQLSQNQSSKIEIKNVPQKEKKTKKKKKKKKKRNYDFKF